MNLKVHKSAIPEVAEDDPAFCLDATDKLFLKEGKFAIKSKTNHFHKNHRAIKTGKTTNQNNEK